MPVLEPVFFHAALAGAAASFALYLVYAATRRERFSLWAHRLLAAAVAAHLLSFLVRAAAARALPDGGWYVPWAGWHDSFSLFAFLIAALFLLVQAETRLPILGAFVLPWAVAALALSLMAPGSAAEAHPALRSIWMAVHVPVMFAAYALFANAFGVGLAYLVQERQIKSKKPTELSYRLPPLEDMDRLVSRIIAAAFPLLTAGLVLGALWAHDAWGRWWVWDAKIAWAVITWAVYLAYLCLRFAAGWRGRRITYLSMAGFAAVLITYVGVHYLSRHHAFPLGS